MEKKSVLKIGTGVAKPVILLATDPNALIEMLDLRVAAFTAGNTGVVNEAVKDGYKIIISKLA